MLVAEIRKLNNELGIPHGLEEVGVQKGYFEKMATDAMKSGNIKVNPRKTGFEDVLFIYENAF